LKLAITILLLYVFFLFTCSYVSDKTLVFAKIPNVKKCGFLFDKGILAHRRRLLFSFFPFQVEDIQFFYRKDIYDLPGM